MFSSLCSTFFCAAGGLEHITVFQDGQGVVRWTADSTEVALFGANYCLPSACDYRAAGYVGGDRKQMIEEDLDHFLRMGWDGLRLCFWGDRQNSDAEGHLVANNHLDLLDYLIAEATERGIYMLFSPIVVYDSQWPEMTDTTNTGLSRHYPKWTMIHDPQAIKAQQTYMSELLLHTNPYTDYALKDEPNILFIELINEPAQFPDDEEGMKDYINGMVGTIRSLGCNKLLFYNVSQDIRVDRVLGASDIQGSTWAWYPKALNHGFELPGNGLPFVDRYIQMDDPYLNHKSKIVYEFDATDDSEGYMIPAMAREFRKGGVQFATLFAYDMLRTAPWNLGWQTHFNNMVFAPEKAVSSIIAAEVMKRVPRGADFGVYPENNDFGCFRVSYAERLSEMNAPDKFCYSNDTQTFPVCPDSLEHLVGLGSSPVVRYAGTGIYFLDKEDKGWRLEVYPDILKARDPFASPQPQYPSRVSVCRSNQMEISLPGLEISMRVEPGIYHFKKNRLKSFKELPQINFFSQSLKPYWIPSVYADHIPIFNAAVDGAHVLSSRTYRSPVVRVFQDWKQNKVCTTMTINSLTSQTDYLTACDVTMAHYIGEEIAHLDRVPESIVLDICGDDVTHTALVLLVDTDGRAYGAEVRLRTEFSIVEIPVTDLHPVKAAMIPQDWPAVNAYWYPQSEENLQDRQPLDWSRVEFLHISIRDENYSKVETGPKSLSVAEVSLKY